MSPIQIITWLGWACYAGALAAIVVYVIHFAGRQGWKRPWNAAGLFFTSIALTQTPFLFTTTDTRGLRSAALVTVCLLAATALQGFVALRRRRRREDDAAAPPAGPAT